MNGSAEPPTRPTKNSLGRHRSKRDGTVALPLPSEGKWEWLQRFRSTLVKTALAVVFLVLYGMAMNDRAPGVTDSCQSITPEQFQRARDLNRDGYIDCRWPKELGEE